MYADHAESKISKLQGAYLRKYLPPEYARSTEVSQHAQGIATKSFGGVMSTLFRGRWEDLQDSERAPPTEGTAIYVHRFQLGLLN